MAARFAIVIVDYGYWHDYTDSYGYLCMHGAVMVLPLITHKADLKSVFFLYNPSKFLNKKGGFLMTRQTWICRRITQFSDETYKALNLSARPDARHGYDLKVAEATTIDPGDIALVPTGQSLYATRRSALPLRPFKAILEKRASAYQLGRCY